ncbi:hypothetical protein [Virgisporangium aurantiacum]|uniref:Uncharacterized protein n=1 Tax=Virgisporangium aurantiacum TaxID=175570 RepID=A0A8J3ZIG6_9ACTN|nr:hypothetical protein [Virgisporangium aurantiacum]GIJ62121.1 hypothetical protein Vau01_096370 [Virgisporangium aurantiacum]
MTGTEQAWFQPYAFVVLTVAAFSVIACMAVARRWTCPHPSRDRQPTFDDRGIRDGYRCGRCGLPIPTIFHALSDG